MEQDKAQLPDTLWRQTGLRMRDTTRANLKSAAAAKGITAEQLLDTLLTEHLPNMTAHATQDQARAA